MLLNLIGKLLNNKLGALNQWAAGAAAGWLLNLVVGLGITMPDGWDRELRDAFMIFGAFLMTAATQWYQSKQNAKVQKAIGAKPDGWIGPETVAVARAIPVPE